MKLKMRATVYYPCVYLMEKEPKGTGSEWFGDECLLHITSVHIKKNTLRGTIISGKQEKEYKEKDNYTYTSDRSVDVKKDNIVKLELLVEQGKYREWVEIEL